MRSAIVLAVAGVLFVFTVGGACYWRGKQEGRWEGLQLGVMSVANYRNWRDSTWLNPEFDSMQVAYKDTMSDNWYDFISQKPWEMFW